MREGIRTCLGLGSLLGLSLFAGTPIPPGSPPLVNHDASSMGAHAQNWSAVQDRQGLIYVGNTAGIFQFDGQQWTRIPMPRMGPVRTLAVGPDGTIYWGGIRDFGRLTPPEAGPVRAQSMLNLVPESQRDFSDVIQILVAKDSICFLAHARTLQLQGGRITSLPGRAPRTQACVMDGTLWYATMEQGLGRVEGDRHLPLGSPELHPEALAPLGTGNLLALDRNRGRLIRIEVPPSQSASPPHLHPFTTGLDGLLGPARADLYRLQPLSQGRLALLTLKAGLLILDAEGRLLHAFNRKTGLVDNTVTGILEDRRGNLWVTTNAGLSTLALGCGQTQYDTRHGLEGGALAVCRYRDSLYVGTFTGLYRLSGTPFQLEDPVPRFHPIPGAPREAWQFLEVDGDLLAGTAMGVIHVDGNQVHLIPGSTALPCLSLVTSRRWPGHLFAGLQGGLEVYRRQGGRWTSLGRIPGIQETLRRLTQDAQGDLWLTTDTQGLIQVHFSGETPKDVVIVRHGQASGLPERNAFSVRAVDGTLYALTRKGVLTALPTPWKGGPAPELHFRQTGPLAEALKPLELEVSDLEPEPGGGFLLNTNQGIARLVPDAKGFQVDFRSFRGGPRSHWRMFLDAEGSLWLPDRALYRVDLRETTGPASFPVLLREVTPLGQTPRHLGGPSPSRPLQFTSREHSLFFRVAAPWFEHPESTRFQFLLEGLDSAWSDWTPSPTREYTRLPAGTYRFRARARNAFGDLGSEALFSFQVLPPWYRSPWALLLWSLMGAGGLAGILQLYTLRLRRQKARLARLVQQRTEDLQRVNERLYHLNDEKNRIIGMAAHDLRSPLSGILMACDLLEDPDPQETPTLAASIRTQGTHMLDLIQGLLDVHAIDAGTAEQPVLASLAPGPVVEAAVRPHRERAARKGIRLEVDLGPDPGLVLADPHHLERVLENLVSNAIKYSPRDRRVRIGLTHEPTHLTLFVADQGLGLTPEDHARLFQTYARLSARPTGGEASVGLGLSIVKKLVEGMGGSIWAEGAPNQGATFYVRLPRAGISEALPG